MALGLTKADWQKIYAKTYKDQDFRTKLESDPTAAIRQYHLEEHGKEMSPLDQIVDLSDWLSKKYDDGNGNGGEGWPPPACC